MSKKPFKISILFLLFSFFQNGLKSDVLPLNKDFFVCMTLENEYNRIKEKYGNKTIALEEKNPPLFFSSSIANKFLQEKNFHGLEDFIGTLKDYLKEYSYKPDTNTDLSFLQSLRILFQEDFRLSSEIASHIKIYFTPEELLFKDFNQLTPLFIFPIGLTENPVEADGITLDPLHFTLHDFFHSTGLISSLDNVIRNRLFLKGKTFEEVLFYRLMFQKELERKFTQLQKNDEPFHRLFFVAYHEGYLGVAVHNAIKQEGVDQTLGDCAKTHYYDNNSIFTHSYELGPLLACYSDAVWSNITKEVIKRSVKGDLGESTSTSQDYNEVISVIREHASSFKINTFLP